MNAESIHPRLRHNAAAPGLLISLLGGQGLALAGKRPAGSGGEVGVQAGVTASGDGGDRPGAPGTSGHAGGATAGWRCATAAARGLDRHGRCRQRQEEGGGEGQSNRTRGGGAATDREQAGHGEPGNNNPITVLSVTKDRPTNPLNTPLWGGGIQGLRPGFRPEPAGRRGPEASRTPAARRP